MPLQKDVDFEYKFVSCKWSIFDLMSSISRKSQIWLAFRFIVLLLMTKMGATYNNLSTGISSIFRRIYLLRYAQKMARPKTYLL